MGVRQPRPADPEIEAIFQARYVPMLRLAALVVQDPAAAEDLVNEGFVRLVLHWDRIRRYDAPEAWLRRVIIREAVKVRTKRGREVVTDLEVLAEPAGRDGIGPVATVVDVRALVACLPTRERAVVVLHYLEDLSVAETADLLRIKEGTVKAHLSHAREALRRALDANPREAL